MMMMVIAEDHVATCYISKCEYLPKHSSIHFRTPLTTTRIQRTFSYLTRLSLLQNNQTNAKDNFSTFLFRAERKTNFGR